MDRLARGKFIKFGLVQLAAISTVAAFNVIVSPPKATALDCSGLSGSRLAMCNNARNDGERYAVRNICTGGATRCGAMWMSTPGTAYTDDTVHQVAWDATSVSLDLRGSVNGNRSPAAQVWATDIRVSQNGRTLLSGTSLYRGRHEGNSYNWYDAGQSVRVPNIDITNVAAPGGSATIVLTVYRCFRSVPGGVGSCADQNVLVTISRQQQPNRWTVSGQSYVSVAGQPWTSRAEALPGQTVRFHHVMQNRTEFTVPANTFRDIYIGQRVDGTVSPHSASWLYNGNAVPPGSDLFSIAGVRPYNIMQPDGVVTQQEVGKEICQNMSLRPKAWNDGGLAWSDWACAVVPHRYDLTPTINVTSSSVNEGSSVVDGITGAVANSGPTWSAKVQYAVIRFVVRGDETTDIAGGESVQVPAGTADWPCEIARQIRGRTGLNISSDSCIDDGLVANSDGTVITTQGLSVMTNQSNNIEKLSLQTGDRLCYTTIVSAYNTATAALPNVFRYAKPVCLTVAKKPKVQFWGGDVRVSNGDVRTSISSLTTNGVPALYGSWAEYGIMASGDVFSASGAGASSTNTGRELLPPAEYNKLTFANTPLFGRFGAISAPPSAANYFGGGVIYSGSSIDLGSIGGSQVLRVGGDFAVHGDLKPGSSLVIRSPGRVTISGNIRYDNSTVSSLSGLPQLIIVARDIVIDAGVEQVDAWLIASGYVSTCNGVATNDQWLEAINPCTKRLRITGPVAASRLYLRRTFGAERTHPGEPAEILNLRPDAYLWSYARSRESGAIKTNYLRELPPRF